MMNLQKNPRSTTDIANPQDRFHNKRSFTSNSRVYPRFNRRLIRSLFYRIYSMNCLTTKWAFRGFMLFTIISTMISVIIICFTKNRSNVLCHVTIKQATENSIINNSRPFSVATGHLNNDNWLDLVVSNSGTNKIVIFLGDGNGSFSLSAMYPTGILSRPVSIAVADMNNDHWMDIIVANYYSHTVGVLFGQGNGNFENQIEFFLGVSRPVSIAVGDLNNDTWLDLVLANNGTDSISVLLGNGNGSFERQMTYSTGYDSFPYSVAIADFDNDGRLDVAVGNYGTNNIAVFLGHGNGTLILRITLSTNLGSSPYSISVADLNNDNRVDIIVANYHAGNVGIFLGSGNETFSSQKTYFLGHGSNPSSVATGHIDNDNQLDIVVSNEGTNSISVLIGYGNGTFATPATYSVTAGSSPNGLTVGDFNNNNQSDVAISNTGTNNIIVLAGYTSISSQNQTVYSLDMNSVPYNLAISDLNNDSYPDIAVANYGTNTIGVLLGYGNGSFREQIAFSTGNGTQPYGLAIGDFNNDHFYDIVVASYNSDYISLLLGFGNGSFIFIKCFFYDQILSTPSVAAGDFNGDLNMDIVLVNLGYNNIMILFGYGNGSFEHLESRPTGDGARPMFVVVADFNNDQYLDIATANFGTNNVGIFLGYGNGSFTNQTTYSTGDGSTSRYLTVGDINNDSCLDIIVANSAANNVGLLLGYCNGSFAQQLTYSTDPQSGPYSVAVSDVNDDQWLDVVVANSGLHSVGVLLGYGNGSFASQLTFSSGLHSLPLAAAVSDFNKDGRMDVAVINDDTNNVAVLLGHPNTRTSTTAEFLLGDYYSDFQSQTYYSTGSSARPYALAVGDFNNDTQLDIVVTNSGTDTIGILLGEGNAFFQGEITYSLGSNSRPRHVIVSDFNRDHRLDIVVSNFLGDSITVFQGHGNGSFTELSLISIASGSNPSSLATGDFNNDSWLDLVVTNMGGNTIDLMSGFKYTSFDRPLKSAAGTNTGLTSVAVGDFNKDGRLDVATANYYSNNVGVLLGYGNGSFAPPVMYANINGSHPWAVAVDDFNNDSILDITLTVWSLNQIGVILGNGDGTFGEPLLYFTGVATRPVAITTGDFNNDGHPDITTANYGTGTVSVFLGYGNGTFADRRTFSTEDGSGPASVTVGDVDKDHHLDIIVANRITYNLGVLYGNGDGTFANITTYLAKPHTSPQYALSGDFNNDSLPDMAVALFGSGDIGVFLGYGNRTFSPIKLYSSGFGSGSQYLQFDDLNDDSYIDIVVSNLITNDIGILFGNGDGTFKDIVLYYMGPAAMFSIATADMNNDGLVDIVFTDGSVGTVCVLFRNGYKPFGGYKSMVYANSSNPSSVAVGHLNNDTYLDLAIANSGTDSVGILFGHGDGTFDDVQMYLTGNGSQPLSIALGDFNNDTHLDIVVANSNTNNIGIFFGSSSGVSKTCATFSTGIASSPVSVIVGDFNHDGVLDIVVANAGTNNVGILIGNGNGSFADPIFYPMGYDSRPNSVVFGHFNNDGWIDIAVSNYAADNIKILLNCAAV